MAKLSSSSRPPLQGMMLLALLLLASIQAAQGQVMAVNPLIGAAKEVGGQVLETFQDHGAEKALNSAATEVGNRKLGWRPAIKGARAGVKAHKYLCKAQGLMEKQNAGGASGTSFFVNLDTNQPVVVLQGITCWNAEPQVPAVATGTLPSSGYPYQREP